MVALGGNILFPRNLEGSGLGSPGPAPEAGMPRTGRSQLAQREHFASRKFPKSAFTEGLYVFREWKGNWMQEASGA